MTVSDGFAAQLCERVSQHVGGFFHNTRRVSGETCKVCTVPCSGVLCPQCRDHRAEFGAGLADLVVPLAYVKANMPQRNWQGKHQSEHHMYAYKWSRPAERCANDLSLMVFAATALHGHCISRSVGCEWQVVTFVPSTKRPTDPAAGLARCVVPTGRPDTIRLKLTRGPGTPVPDRTVRADRFVLADDGKNLVTGRHIIVVDDTWVSGAKAQSAALALKQAGAGAVTVLCVGRWLRADWDDHWSFMSQLTAPYDAATCPVTGGHCPSAN